MPNDNNTLDTEVVVPLNINKSIEISITPEVRGDNPVYVIQITGATLQINNAKLYVPVGTLSVNDNIKFFENIKQVFKRTI